jgi:hypothetical protein
MDVIGQLLRAGLLTQIGESEDRVRFVRAASAALADRLGSELRPLVPHALMAGVDESSSGSVEPLIAADKALSAEWSTYRNAFTEPPVEILRAMLVAAVSSAAEKDSDLLAAGWYALRSAIDFMPVSRWQAPLTELVESWDNAVWASVESSWSPVDVSSTLRMPAVSKFEEEKLGVKSNARTQAQTLAGAANWQVFAQQMQETYVDHVNSLLAASEFLAAQSHRRSVESMRLRGDLLWWQQTSFSPSRRVGYSELEAVEVPLVAALDLHLLMPKIAPLAAEHMLSELVSRTTNDPKMTIEELAGAAVAGLPGGAGHAPASVLDAIQSTVETPLMTRDYKVNARRFAVLAFRDLQARRLARGGGSGES